MSTCSLTRAVQCCSESGKVLRQFSVRKSSTRLINAPKFAGNSCSLFDFTPRRYKDVRLQISSGRTVNLLHITLMNFRFVRAPISLHISRAITCVRGTGLCSTTQQSHVPAPGANS